MVDAQASSERTGIGGWLPDVGKDGRPRTHTSLLFSHEINRDELPWIFERSGKPSLMISSLEALAVIVALKVFFPTSRTDSRRKIDLVPTWTDNRGNGSALNKLMSTRFPASALLMELATHMKEETHKGECSVGSKRNELRSGPISERQFRRVFARVSYPHSFPIYAVVHIGRGVIYGSRC